MPLKFNPNSKFEIWLDSDEVLPCDKRPTIQVKVLSMNELSKLGEVWDNAPKEDTKSFFNYLAGELLAVFVSWKNFINPETGEEIPLTAEAIGDVFTFNEAKELFSKISSASTLNQVERKKSD